MKIPAGAGRRRKIMYNLFISHSWAYSYHYDNLINLLDSRPYFNYKNYSVPKENPIHNSPTVGELRLAIQKQMSYASVIIILAGVYATRSKWINIEIDLAQHGFLRQKPIIAIKPRENTLVSSVVRGAATELINWNTESIILAIRRNAI